MNHRTVVYLISRLLYGIAITCTVLFVLSIHFHEGDGANLLQLAGLIAAFALLLSSKTDKLLRSDSELTIAETVFSATREAHLADYYKGAAEAIATYHTAARQGLLTHDRGMCVEIESWFAKQVAPIRKVLDEALERNRKEEAKAFDQYQSRVKPPVWLSIMTIIAGSQIAFALFTQILPSVAWLILGFTR